MAEMNANSEPDRPNRTRPDALALYKVAYDESVRAIDDQLAELDHVRSRAMQFLAFIGTGTAFLVGTGLNDSQRDGWFYALATVGSAMSVVTLLLVGAILLGVVVHEKKPQEWRWAVRLSAQDLIRWIEPQIHAPDEVDYLKEVALLNDERAEANEVGLGRLRHVYLALLTSGFVQLLIWAALVWARG
ncbi:hypothetical protein [Nocardioides nematodiphilus]|uniref:hypothetical protein n=1 Tax=Nocardioides nematodiphilus TaxID=2849669 RepID=UPI001CDA4296|nr:hypothetical protein [Nocardioides nematodiphilus]MCA1982973.1 hypothetical protein [Nocardioides nematodiphilus]